MDSSKPPSDEVQLQKSPIPTFLKQYYSLPSPIIKYMLENASAINYFKLFQTCKILQKFIQEKYGPQIDVLEVGNFNHDLFSIQARNNEIKISGSEEIYYEFPKNQKLWVRKPIYFDGTSAAKAFDIISYTLKHLPNLKSFKLPWNRNLTTFDGLTAIKRDKKLQKAEIYFFEADFDKKSLSEFISKQLALGSTLCLRFEYSFAKNVKNKYQNFADEFNKISSAKIVFERYP
uniref:F-box domain-containing protein n=1 Tax=Panagrolaimus davidi TaxID=227884 RepID=A0A914PLN0_9BILA